MRNIKILCRIIILLMPISLWAQNLKPVVPLKPNDPIPLDAKVRYGKLPNGLTYYVRQNSKPEKRVEMRLLVNAGSVQEMDNQQGIAHFVEHMAFNGTRNFPKNELLNYFQKAGVRFGADLNATTSFDFTMYMLPVPTDNDTILRKSFQVLRDWAGNILMDPEEIEKERGVILEEKRMRQNANQRMLEKFLPVLTNNSMYGRRLPIGKEEIIRTAPKQVFDDYYRKWYRPNNMAIIIVGDIDVEQTIGTIKKLFSDLKNPANTPLSKTFVPIEWHKANKVQVVGDKEMTNDQVQIYFNMKRMENTNTWSSLAGSIQQELISELFNARLLESFVDPKSPISAGSISPHNQFLGTYSNSNIFALVKTNVNDAIAHMVREVKSAKEFGFSEKELERAKKNYFKRYDVALQEKDKTESISYVSEYVEHFLNKTPSPGISAEYAFVRETLDKFSVAKANQLTKAIDLDKPVYILCTTTETSAAKISEAAVLKAYAEALQQKPVPHVEKTNSGSIVRNEPTRGRIMARKTDAVLGAEVLELSNGINVVYKRTDYKNDEIMMRGSQWGGLSKLSDADVRIANYFPFVSTLGLGANKSTELNELLSGANIIFSIGAGPSQVSLFGRSTVPDLEKFFQVMYMRLTDVNWDANEFAGVKQSFASQIGMLSKNPVVKFNDTVSKFKYAYSPRQLGLPVIAEIDALQADELKRVYGLVAGDLKGATLVFTGSIPEQQFIDLVERYVASLPVQEKPAGFDRARVPQPIKGNNRFSFHNGKENKSEIAYSFYGRFDELTDKEILSFLLLSEILQIQATQKLREEMGSTYSPRVSSSLQRKPLAEYLLALNVSSLPENTEKIVEAFNGLVNTIKSGKLPEEDLAKARTQRLRVFETQSKTNDFWAFNLEQYYSYRFDPTILTEYSKRIEPINAADIVSIARKLLDNANVLNATMNPEQ